MSQSKASPSISCFNKCHFSYGWYSTEKTIIRKPLCFKLSNVEKEEVLTRRIALLKQVPIYFDINLNPAKANIINPTKDHFTQSNATPRNCWWWVRNF